MHTLAKYWVGAGGSEGVSACQKGHNITNYGDAWTKCMCVCTAAPKRESVTLAVGGEGQVNSVEVFNPTATTLGISIPYHL